MNKYDDSSKTTLITKEAIRTTDITMENHQLTDRVLVRNTSVIGHTDRKREEYNSNNLEIKPKNSQSKKLSEVSIYVKKIEYETNN